MACMSAPSPAELDPQPNSTDREQAALSRLPTLFELWDDYYQAATPVTQADCLLAFSNAMCHLRWAYEGDLDNTAGTATDADTATEPADADATAGS